MDELEKRNLGNANIGDDGNHDDLPQSLRDLLGENDDGDDATKDDAPKPVKEYVSSDGKKFKTIEEYEAYATKRDQAADVKFRSAAQLNQSALEQRLERETRQTKREPELKKIDLKEIDPDDTVALRNAMLNNERVHEQELAEIRSKIEASENSVREKDARTEMRRFATAKVKERGIKLPEADIEEFLDKAENSTTINESVEALMDLIEKTERTSVKSVQKKDPLEDGEPLRAPDGVKNDAGSIQKRLKMNQKILELQRTGDWEGLDTFEQINLTRAARGLPPLKS